MKEKVLFSPLGTTDPIRGFRDGPMLHIVRHYRPDKIFLFISDEIKRLENKDDRFSKALNAFLEKNEDYKPEIIKYYSDIVDVSDFDAFYEIFAELLKKLHEDYPDAELLLNLSSGSPQMKATLALLAGTLNYNLRVIQVKNPEKKAGTTTRTNNKDYDIDAEIELNEDEDEGVESRYSEPKLTSIFRDRQYAQVKALLKRYDYDALKQMKKSLPDDIFPLIDHLSYRSSYDIDNAELLAKDIKSIDLYPAKNKSQNSYNKYKEISEYVLLLKLMQRTQKYTDMVIRLNPFVIRLQREWLVSKGIDFGSIGTIDPVKGEIMDREKIANYNKELLDFMDSHYGGEFKSSPLNIYFCNYLIEFIGEKESETAVLFEQLSKLNLLRNKSAHSLKNLTDEQIEEVMGYNSAKLIKKLIEVISQIYPQHFDEELFSIYDSANRYIGENL